MRIAFKPLFRVNMRHSFYTSGASDADFSLEAAPATHRVLSNHGLVLRPLPAGFAVYGEVKPGNKPHELLRPLGGTLRLTFLVRNLNPHLWNISNLPEFRPGQSVFYFNNLREDSVGRLHLGDSAAGVRVGPPIQLVSGETYTHRFKTEVNAATLTIKDLFGNTISAPSFKLPDATAKTKEHRLDFSRIDNLVPGQYTITDNHGGSGRLYYDPEIFENRPFGIVEIFDDGLVPASYRFLNGNQLTGVKDYHVQLERRSTTWRYVVIKKTASNGLQLDSLAVNGEIDFTKVPNSDPPVFASDDPVPLREKRANLVLVTDDGDDEGDEPDRLRNLPSPAAGTPLQSGATTGSYVSELYIYV